MFGSLFRSEERAIQSMPWGAWAGDNTVNTWSGANVDSKSALQLLTVYGCVRLICDSIATLPLDIYSQQPDGTKKELSLPSWLETPVIGLHRSPWLTQIISSLLLDGNAYVAVTRNPAGAIVELVPIDCTTVTVTREEGRRVYYVNGNLPRYEMLHIPGLMLAGSDKGVSPVEAARQSIGLGMATQEFAARFFSQGAVMSGVIEDPATPDANKARDTARIFGRAHNGKEKAHLPAVLMGGMTWKSTGVTNEQAQFLETRGFSASEIAGQMFLVDPSDLGIPVPGVSLTYANLTDRNTRRWQVTLLPWLVRLETALSSLLAKPRYVKFNVDGLLRADLKTRYDSYGVGIQNKFIVPNEARVLEDLPPLDGGDVPPMTAGAPGAKV
jgi:HK97 family phage portal protein